MVITQYCILCVLAVNCDKHTTVCNRTMAGVDGSYFIGVDVGTSSVRAALVTSSGHLLCSASCAITIWEPEPNFYEQSSSDIWQACCTVVRVSLIFSLPLYFRYCHHLLRSSKEM